MKAILTDHAIKRMRKRIGLNKKAVQKLADTALEKGLTYKDVNGRVKRYFRSLYFNKESEIVLYGEYVFIFKEGNVLVTVMNIPSGLRKYVEKLKESI